MDRKKEQSDLIFKLGLLFKPLVEYTESIEEYSRDKVTKIAAQFFDDLPKIESEFLNFTRKEKGHFYQIEYKTLHGLFHKLASAVTDQLYKPKKLKELLETNKNEIINTLSSIPVHLDSQILDAHTPFSTYCLIKDYCQTVKNRIIWVDRYLDDSVYYRYLRDVPKHVKIFLITWPESKRVKNKKDKETFETFINISKLFLNERGSSIFLLMTNEKIHDRWVCFDQNIYSLGGSIKDASDFCNFTLSKLESSSDNFNKIEKLLIEGKEIKFS